MNGNGERGMGSREVGNWESGIGNREWESGIGSRERERECGMSLKSLETLETWCKARDFALRIYKEVLPLLPPEEKWNLNQQLRRSSLSIPANIAEGYGRFYYQDNVRFCYNARGSLEETLSHLSIAGEMNLIPQRRL